MVARSLLALRRSTEAVAVLQQTLRGGVDRSNTHQSRTRLHEALAAACEQAGELDSAVAHHAIVEWSWWQAEPAFQARYRRARPAAALRRP